LPLSEALVPEMQEAGLLAKDTPQPSTAQQPRLAGETIQLQKVSGCWALHLFG
jgi:hypothetical protein